MVESPVLYVLLDRLKDAGITATVTTETTISSIYGGPRDAEIWIAADADEAIANDIASQVEAEMAQSFCGKCGYDLHGHSGKTTCPECGHHVHAREYDYPCPHCGERVPSTMAMCWNCGKDRV